MNEHIVQVGYDDKTHRHYACVIDSVTKQELHRTKSCKSVAEALRLAQANVNTRPTKLHTPTSSEKAFPQPIIIPSNKQFCSG